MPARLAVRNFLCYRDCPPIDFSAIHVACLTGDNGNGKSALLDAITWALWGRARAKSDGDLVTLGRTEMEVEFEFWAGDARYRVLRKYRRVGSKGAGQTGLEFQIRDGEDWRAISGSTQAESQRKILDVIKLSYDTFVNSSFLVQGRADAFTVKSPGERKEVLGEILDLGRYDAYEARAKEERNERARTGDMLERQIHDAEVELARLPAHRQERDHIHAELNDLSADLARETEARDALRAVAAAMEALARELERARRNRDQAVVELARVEERISTRRETIDRCTVIVAQAEAVRAGYRSLLDGRDRLREAHADQQRLGRERADLERMRDQAAAELTRLEGQAGTHRAIIRRHQQLVAEGDAIRDGFAHLQSARAALSEQDQRLAGLRRIQARIEPLQSALARAESRLAQEAAVKQAEVDRLADTAARADALEQQRREAERAQVELDALAQRLASLRSEESEQRGEVTALQSQNARLREEMDELKRKLVELQAAEQRGEADCPLCKSNLGHAGFRSIEESYQADGSTKAAQYRTNQRRIQDLEASAQARGEEARRLDADLTRRQGEWKSRVALLDRQVAEARDAAERLDVLRPEARRLADAIESGDFAHAERTALEALRSEAAAIAYDEQAHARAREDLQALAEFEGRHQALARAETEIAAARQALGSDETAIAGWRGRREEASERLERIQDALAALAVEPLQQEVSALTEFEARHEELRQADSQLTVAREALTGDEAVATNWRRQRGEADGSIAELEARRDEFPDASAQLPALEERARALGERVGELKRAQGACEQEIDRLEEMERQTASRRRQLDEVRRELSVYDDLVVAFGKRGVQALLIEAVLPEIEGAANELLARMTNNRMHVALETQRTAQKGHVIETLDIKIADEWGTRSYEMFSGGEAFRINLALRIALSKLLARRAGAPLATLVIDEGFGTQDVAGRERLVEAITAIQDHFQCLLLVTHIEELKDLFETRIEVTKSGDGSVARVVAA